MSSNAYPLLRFRKTTKPKSRRMNTILQTVLNVVEKFKRKSFKISKNHIIPIVSPEINGFETKRTIKNVNRFFWIFGMNFWLLVLAIF